MSLYYARLSSPTSAVQEKVGGRRGSRSRKCADLRTQVPRSACSANLPPCQAVHEPATTAGTGGESACISATRRFARTARRTSTGGWCARCGATARSCRRRWRNLASWTPRVAPRRRRWRGRSPAAASSESCSRSRRPERPTVPVRLDRIRVERGRSFGDVWLGWRLWQALRLDVLCEELLPRGREQVPWSVMAAVLVIARLCEPRASCTSRRTGTAGRRSRICWGCLRSG